MIEAKRLGRNTVVQLGAGLGNFDEPDGAAMTAPISCDGVFAQRNLVTSVPLRLAVEKLRGFVLDHNANIVSIKADVIEFEIEGSNNRAGRRRSDRPVPFLVALGLAEQRLAVTSPEGRAAGHLARTRVRVTLRLKRPRDLKNLGVAEQANSILASVKSYLMASDETEPVAPKDLRRAANLLSLWHRN